MRPAWEVHGLRAADDAVATQTIAILTNMYAASGDMWTGGVYATAAYVYSPVKPGLG